MKTNEKNLLEALAKANVANKVNLQELHIHEGLGLSAESLKNLLSANKPVVLCNTDNTTKDALLEHLGITLPGSSDYLLIRPLGTLAGDVVYHIMESNDVVEREAAMGEAISGTYLGGGTKPEEADAPEADEEPQQPMAAKSVLDYFAKAMVDLWDSVNLDATQLTASATDDEPPTKLWIWSKQYNHHCSGSKHNGYTPPEQTMTAYVTYSVQCYLNQAVTGNFQWMYVEVLGYWDTNGMKTDKSNHRGWGNLGVKPTVSTPSGFSFYSCSPTNTNKTKTVTSEVGFEVGLDKDGPSGTYSVSKSESNEISDWEVVLESVNNWKFQQYSPFKGYRTSFPSDAVYYSSSSAKHKIHGYPNLTKATFNFCTMSVFKTNTVLTKTVSLPISMVYEPGIVQISNSWPSWSGYFWYYRSTYYENFQIDMSKVS